MKKTVFITGAGGYIGGETALTFAREGFNVAACDIKKDANAATLERVRKVGG